MTEGQAKRVQRLTLEVDDGGRWILGKISPLTDERMPANRGLNADLISPAGPQPHFQQRRIPQILDHFVVADRFFSI